MVAFNLRLVNSPARSNYPRPFYQWAIMSLYTKGTPIQEDATRLTARQTGIFTALAVMAATTCIALTVDYYGWELEFSLWLQGFSLGGADFLRDGMSFAGARVVSGAALVAVCAALWARRWRLEAVFVALVLVPDALNILIKELIARPRPTADLVDVAIGFGGIQGSAAFPAATRSTPSCSAASCFT